MSDQERCIRRAGRALVWISILSVVMGVLVAAKISADVESDIKGLREAVERIGSGWWKELLPGGVVVGALLSAVGVLWKALLRNQKMLLDGVKEAASERQSFLTKLDGVIKTGEESQAQRRDAVDLLVRKMDDQQRNMERQLGVISEYLEEKKKSPDTDEDQATVRAGLRKR